MAATRLAGSEPVPQALVVERITGLWPARLAGLCVVLPVATGCQ